MLRFCLSFFLILALGADLPARAERVPLTGVETSMTPGSATELAKAVDGIEAGPEGWRVVSRGGKGGNKVQSAVFRCAAPLPQGRLRLWLSFLSGKPDAHFREFAVAFTRDARPSLTSRWEPLFPVWFTSTEGELLRVGDHVRADSRSGTPVFRIDTGLVPDGVTGLRLEVMPTDAAGEAVLTEFRVDRMDIATTNIALGCTVTASHELGGDGSPEVLTDGLAGNVVYPKAPDLGAAFYFEIDLRQTRTLDHISLRSRADSRAPERLSHVILALYEAPPESGAAPLWTAHHREDGSYPEPGQTDVIRANKGSGVFRGRYLRISSDSEVAFSPQLAEVEVYESLIPPGVSVEAGGQKMAPAARLKIPAESPWISFAIEHPVMPVQMTLGRRWRLLGLKDTWLPVTGTGIVESRGLPPGRYEFQAAVRHSDNEWNQASLVVPIFVPVPWWINPYFQSSMALAVVALASLGGWQIARVRLARQVLELERRQELDRERARIARDMHDVVGARLTQLAVMQEIFATEHPQTPAAQEQLQRLSGTARDAVAALDEAVWAVNPRNDTLQNVADYLCQAATDYLAPLGIACRQIVTEAWPAVTVGAQKRHQLLLAFKEALQNIVKHAAATQVTLTLRDEAPGLFLRLEDNGRGLPVETGGAGKDGLDNMGSRLASVGGECRIRPRDKGGTMVEMRLPL